MDKDKEYAYREAFDLSRHYMDKLESILLRFGESINSPESAKKSFESMKSDYTWKRFFLRALAIAWPVIFIVVVTFGIRFMPCGSSIDVGPTKIKASACASSK